ncbi:MAG: YicC family protein [Saprospiraceae bacterium]|nr:YicC family protein [Saprospiraceae bacterium]
MTGFGHGKREFNGKVIRVEIKSLNARTTEIRCKLPNNYRDKEMDIRKQVVDFLQRGKLDVTISTDDSGGEDSSILNKALFRKYYKELSELKDELGIENGDILQSILRIPNVMGTNEENLDDEEWAVVEQAISDGLESIQKFRAAEGEVLKQDLIERVKGIEFHLKRVEAVEGDRMTRIKERLRKNMEEFVQNQSVDQGRFEQEMLYYIEKLDINEEKVRLGQHCIYFLEELNNKDEQKGRKLSFISQEIGREINTIGAKAQDSEIQQCVVMMKDELEKLKEQLANIL